MSDMCQKDRNQEVYKKTQYLYSYALTDSRKH